MKTSTVRAMTTSFFDTTTNLWLDAFMVGNGVDSTTVTTTTTDNNNNDSDNDDIVDKDNNEDPIGKDNNNLIF